MGHPLEKGWSERGVSDLVGEAETLEDVMRRAEKDPDADMDLESGKEHYDALCRHLGQRLRDAAREADAVDNV